MTLNCTVTYLQTVQYISATVACGTEDIENRAVSGLSGLFERDHSLWQLLPSQEHGHGVPARVGRDGFPDLYGVVSQEVVQDQLSGVTKHGVRVVPVAIEAQHLAVIVQKLLQCVVFLVRPQWLHRLVQLQCI